MGSIVKRTVTEVTFMENTSSDDDIRAITLRLESEGSGRYLVLSNGRQGCEMYLHGPDDLRVIYETACQLWAQGDVMVPGDAKLAVTPQHPPFEDSVTMAFASKNR